MVHCRLDTTSFMYTSENGCLQDDAKRLAEQRQALEEARSKWSMESSAQEAQLAKREQAAGAAGRQRDAEQRRRQAQEEQVPLLCSSAAQAQFCIAPRSQHCLSSDSSGAHAVHAPAVAVVQAVLLHIQ